jgi:hypothetical protein
MKWENYSRLKGKHSALSPSSCYWIFDDENDFEKRYCNSFSTTIGTLLHDQACKYIQNGPKIGFRMSKKSKNDVLINLLDAGVPFGVMDYIDFDGMYDNMTRYVNDAIGYEMDPEVCLYFSENCFGHADAISYNEVKGMLRIHDLKTGAHPCDVRQLMIYAADFCLEQQISPYDISFELRIYQNNDFKQWNPSSDDINVIMNALKRNSKIILNKMKREE